MFGVRIGKDAVFPAEVCEVIPGQLYRKKLSPENTTQFLRFSVQKPHERLMTITNGVNGQVGDGALARCAEMPSSRADPF